MNEPRIPIEDFEGFGGVCCVNCQGRVFHPEDQTKDRALNCIVSMEYENVMDLFSDGTLEASDTMVIYLCPVPEGADAFVLVCRKCVEEISP